MENAEKYLIRASEIDQLPGIEKIHFLNEHAKRVEKSLGDLTGLHGLAFYLIKIAPGFQSTEYHKHHFEDFCAYVLTGTGIATIGNEEFSVGPGDFIAYRAGGLAHTLRAIGSEELACIVVGQRLPHEIVDYPYCKKRQYTTAGFPSLVVDYESIDEQ
jgi:uncharacterized cupin superfamily protein